MNPSSPAPMPARRVVVEHADPKWRREPYRLLFPLGALLGWAGVVHWLLFATGATTSWKSTFHALTLVQGFMLCFALGFLYTFIPRRTGTSGPSAPQLGASLLLPVLLTLSAWLEAWALSQVLFLAQMAVLLSFVLARVMSAKPGRPVPEGMVWVPVAVLMGAVGSVLTLLPMSGSGFAHALGTGWLLQGMFTCLVLGVGGMLLPMFLHGRPPAMAPEGQRRWRKAAHLFAAALFAASFPLELLVSSSLGHALRAAVAMAVLIWPTRLWNPPTSPGLHRWFIWGSGWMLPLGFVTVALQPNLRTAGLHVVFLGSFALMALAVSVHVVLAHGGHKKLLEGYPWQVAAVGGLTLAALVARLLMAVAPEHLRLWLGGAAMAFLVATFAWTVFLVPLTRGEPTPHA